MLSRPHTGLTPTETSCPPEHCLPGVRDIPSVIGADDLLHKHWYHKEGSTCLKTTSDNVTYIFQRSFREIVTYRWMSGREEIKGLAQNFAHRYPAGTVVENPPANAGNTWDTGCVPGLRRCLWIRKWQPTPVFLPGKSHGQRSLVSSPWDHKKLDLTEHTYVSQGTTFEQWLTLHVFLVMAFH